MPSKRKCSGGTCLLNPLGVESACWDCPQWQGKRPKPPRVQQGHKPLLPAQIIPPPETDTEKACPACGKLFYGPGNQVYCCRSCAKRAYKRRLAARGGVKLYDERECIICHLPFIPRTDRQKTCGGECSKIFLREKYRRGIPRNYPPAQQSARRQAKDDMETAQNAPVEHIKETVLQIRRHNPTAYVTPSALDSMAEKMRAALPWIATLDKPRQAALLDIAFSWGMGGFLGLSSFLRWVQAGKWEKARQVLLNTRYASSCGRAAVENARQIATGEWTLIKPYDPRNYDEDEDAWDDGYELGEDGSVWER